MNGQGDPRELSIELLRELEAQALRRPVLQAIAIYDCEATRESVVVLEHKATFMSVVLTFGEEAGPVVRWFFKPGRFDWSPDKGFFAPPHEVAPINRYGCAVVMSSNVFKAFETLMQAERIRPADQRIPMPQVYDLNKDKKK